MESTKLDLLSNLFLATIMLDVKDKRFISIYLSNKISNNLKVN